MLDVLVFKGVLYFTVAGDVSVLIIFMNVVVINCHTGKGGKIEVLAATVLSGRFMKKNRWIDYISNYILLQIYTLKPIVSFICIVDLSQSKTYHSADVLIPDKMQK